MTRSLVSIVGVSIVGISLGFAAPAYAEKCQFSGNGPDAHDRDDNDPPLKCHKCEEIAEKITRKDTNVWTLDLKYKKPRRVEVKKALQAPNGLWVPNESEVYWFVYYELTNQDTVPHPCYVDVMAESDKGKNVYTYHDSAVPEVVEEVRRIEGLKDEEALFTQTELCLPPAGSDNKVPNQDGTIFEQTYEDGRGLTEPKSGKPSHTRFLQRMTDAEGKTLVVKDGPARIAFSTINPGEKRRCVAIFTKMDAEMDVLTVYFHGLCNSTYGTSDPTNFLPPEANPVGENDLRIINDDVKAADPYRRKVIDRVFAIEYECPGDEFAKSSRQIKEHDEQLLRPRNLAKEEEPVRYHDVGIFGIEIVEAEEKSIEGKKATPFTYLARKWIQVERTIKSDLR